MIPSVVEELCVENYHEEHRHTPPSPLTLEWLTGMQLLAYVTDEFHFDTLMLNLLAITHTYLNLSNDRFAIKVQRILCLFILVYLDLDQFTLIFRSECNFNVSRSP